MSSTFRREASSSIISRVYVQWSSEQKDVVPGDYEDNEHSLLMDASPEADADLRRRTADALRAAGYGRNGQVQRISPQRAKQYVNEFLAAEPGAKRVAGSASRIGPVWCVSEIDPDHPEDMLIGRALVVFDDGQVYSIGSMPPDEEVTDLLNQLDPMRRPLSVREPWTDKKSADPRN